MRLLLWLPAALLFVAEVAAAQSTAPSAILNQYRNQRTTWFTMIWPYANNLFGVLATIEFAWSAAVMLLERSDLQSWTSALIRKLMWLGAFYALLLYGRYWIPAIIDSFELIGQRASGSGPLSPGDVFSRGLDLAGALMATSSAAAFFTNLGTSLTMVVTGLITALAFIAITVQFVVAMVESYIIVAAGFVFVGFGGSRWTAPYVERYIALGVANGVKIMLLYLLVGTGMTLSVDWMTEAQKIAGKASPAMSALEIMGASIIFMMLCWQIPKLFAAVLGGSPALAGGDLIGAGVFLTGGAVAVGSAGFAAAGAVTGVASTAPAMLASVGRSGGDGGSVPPPEAPTPSPGSPPTSGPHGTIASDNAAVSFGSNTPAPPSAPNTAATRSPSLTNAARRLRGMQRGAIVRLPSDAGPAASPPRMNIDHHD